MQQRQIFHFVRLWYIFLATIFYFRVVFASKVSLEEILSQADGLLVDGQTDEAILVYQKGIDQAAVLSNGAEDVVDDDESLTTLLSLYANLGTALSSQEENAARAVECYQLALQLYQRHRETTTTSKQQKEASDIAASAAFYLGMVYQDLGNARDAVEAYGLAIQLDTNLWSAAANQGSVQQDMLKDYRQALTSYNQAYRILMGDSPTDPPEEPYLILSQLQYRIGLCIAYSDPTQKCIVQDEPDRAMDCRELATHAFALAVQYDPHNEFAKHMLASMTADATMTRASNEYVKALFDQYATNFEHSLVTELHYTGFQRLRRGFDRAIEGETTNMFPMVLDAGCGTGLAGEQFRNISKTLIGVDLSQAILDQAVLQRPGLYDQIIVGDVVNVVRRHHHTTNGPLLSLIIAADSYIYFGNLDPLFEAMHQGLEVGGLVAFTLENVNEDDERILEQSKSDWRWQLTASGRFAHRKEYVVKTGEQHGFTVLHYEALNDFRYESGVGVRGHLFVLRKLLSVQEGHNEL